MPWSVLEAEAAIGKLWNLSISAVQRRLSQNLRSVSALYDNNIRSGADKQYQDCRADTGRT